MKKITKIQRNTDWIIPVLLFGIIICSFVLGLSIKGGFMMDFDLVELTKWDATGKVGCESDSMGLTLGCNDYLYQKKVTKDERLRLGDIYVYEKPGFNKTVVHRLVQIVDNHTVLFKGDNNLMAEYVPREHVLYKVEMVKYR